MKKYMMGLGAMLVGAGLMFVLMHGEVEADNGLEPFICSTGGHIMRDDGTQVKDQYESTLRNSLAHCRVGKLHCAYEKKKGNIFCVQPGGLFK